MRGGGGTSRLPPLPPDNATDQIELHTLSLTRLEKYHWGGDDVNNSTGKGGEKRVVAVKPTIHRVKVEQATLRENTFLKLFFRYRIARQES